MPNGLIKLLVGRCRSLLHCMTQQLSFNTNIAMYFCCRHALRVHFVSDAQFHRDVEDGGGGHITGYFHSSVVLISATQPLNFDELIRIFNNRVEQFTQRGSGYVLSNIIKLSMLYVTFVPLGGGSSYIPTPKFIAKKRAVVNVKSHGTGTDCFRCAVLAALYPVRRNANRLSSYVRHRDAIDCSELLFPVHPYQIKIFEQNNPLIAIHCLALNDKKRLLFRSVSVATHAPTTPQDFVATTRRSGRQ